MSEDKQVEIFMMEYEKLRDEMVQITNNQQQALVLALGSASIAIPLLLGQTQNISLIIIVELLYTLVIIYSTVAMNFVSGLYGIVLIGRYIHEYIEPEVNRITNSSSGHKVLYWESFLRQEKVKPPSLILTNVGSIGALVLLLSPGAISLVVVQYLLSLTQPAQQITTPKFIFDLLPLLSIIAWCSYFLAIGSLILLLIYAAVGSQYRWFNAKPKVRTRR